MTFWQGFKYVHRESWAFVLACPLIIFIPVLVEFAQHVVEMQIGMYNGPDGAEAAENSQLRLQVGFLKTLAISVIGYSVIRFLAGGRDAAAARRLDPAAVKLFSLVFALQALLAYLALFVFTGATPLGIGFTVFGLIFGPLVVRFFVAAPLGVLISPMESARQMWRQLPWAFAFNLIAVLPLMVVHYALGIGAVFVPGDPLKWSLLVVDSLLVGWLAALLAAISWVMAMRKDPPPSLGRASKNAGA